MSLAEKLINDFNALPDEKQREVLDFVEFLRTKEKREVDALMDSVIEENKEAFLELAK